MQTYKRKMSMDENNKNCRITQVKNVLSRNGFYCVWLQQSFTDIIVQEWNAINQDKDRYFPYRSVKSIFEPEQYLSILEMKCLRVRFLATTTWCATNSQQSSSLQILCYTEKLCILCENDRNEERLFICPLYLDMREKRMDNTSRLSKMSCLRKARQRCLDWASLFPMRLREETSLQGQTSFTM